MNPSAAKLTVYVAHIHKETPYVKRFELIRADGKPLPPFSGGAYITTYVRDADTDQIIERSYSLAQDPSQRDYYAIAIRRSPTSKGGSVYWHDSIREGDLLEISYPKNHFPLSFQARHHVFYAAGIGITPFLAMMADLEAKHRSFELHYAAKSKEECAFYSLLQETYPEKCRFYFSEDPSSQKLTTESMKDQPIGSHVYFCGPEAMIKQFSDEASSYGYPKGSIHYELFAPPTFGSSDPFQVVLKQSGQALDVSSEQSLLECLLQSGVKAPYSCRSGGCGSCEVEVLEGQVDHRDLFLSEEEKKQNKVILTCVSRAKSKELVLNL
ncbi:2Fe-2S iron-sulfur cluster-binding protein [Ammoniphilus sp. 3BR4]|uniref:PDR/VanB family oxidoreductase n=1 Tax=Ammoniphilus sp. 3BR4 TaxID=3158265 RepID=UPI0034654FD5